MYPEIFFRSAPEKIFKPSGKNFKALEKNFECLEENFQAVRKIFSSRLKKNFKPPRKKFSSRPENFKPSGKSLSFSTISNESVPILTHPLCFFFLTSKEEKGLSLDFQVRANGLLKSCKKRSKVVVSFIL